ncbi:MAG: hypothetical protein GY822_02285 [Deltaproteobacteria bacterium]|nr:hypothetical protein [Deltaproteobacteria bacterium]
MLRSLPSLLTVGAALVFSTGFTTTTTTALAGTKSEICPTPKSAALKAKKASADGKKARDAAQKGLSFLADTAPKWAAGHACYGCHVHAVTLEAFVTGKQNQYDVSKKAMNTILEGILNGPGGTRSAGGLQYAHGGTLKAPSKAFGGAALAHYDQHIDDAARDDLLKTARELMAFQEMSSGRMNTAWTNGRIGVGDVQTTFQAVQTWRQAYARTADDAWLAPLRRGEKFLSSQATAFKKNAPGDVQQLNYALLGLAEAGAQGSERNVAILRGDLLERQNRDGGWALSRGGSSDAFGTGQTLYTLRRLGLTDSDAAVRKGTRWLIGQQKPNGGWSQSGSAKAEAMWGVLGLVSIDVLSLEIAALSDGQHFSGKRKLIAKASDNKGRGVRKVEIFVDDVSVGFSCGPKVSVLLDAAVMSDGVHLVDIRAENATGQTSSRRLTVYTGDTFLTEIGSEFRGNNTLFSARNLAGDDKKAKIEVTIYEEIKSKDGTKRGRRIFSQQKKSEQGPVSFAWDGKDKAGKKLPNGRYVAELSFIDEKRGAVQKVEHVFTHQSAEEARKNFAEVAGKLNLGALGSSANTQVELVDDDGNVVQRVTSTRGGNYRFKGVDTGKYKVRIQKKGYKAQEAEVEAVQDAPAAKADMALEVE